ncbi:MAG: pantoate kinase [Methanosarcinales archaeon]
MNRETPDSWISKTRRRAFAPSHITGFFVPVIRESALESGSLGAGICLNDGVVAEVVRDAASMDETRVTLSGKPFHSPPLSDALLELTSEPLKVDLHLDIPLGAGFGASGASILAALHAANDALGLNLSHNEITLRAHRAEVAWRTGLGDVIAQTTGGVVLRIREGAPPHGRVTQIPAENVPVSWAFFQEISTATVLEDTDAQKRISLAGRSCLKRLIERPSLKNLMIESRRFTCEVGLASESVIDAIESAEARGVVAAQAMLGDTVFAIGEDIFSEYKNSGTSLIDKRGVRGVP